MLFLLQANTVIASEASSRMEAFTDVEVNLSGEAAQSVGPAAAGLVANGHATEVSPLSFSLCYMAPVLRQGPSAHIQQTAPALMRQNRCCCQTGHGWS